MIVVRAPHRVSFYGGGSDFIDHMHVEGFVSGVYGMSINLYSYVSATFPAVKVRDRFRISYSKTESAEVLSELDHELARETLRYFDFDSQIHISSMSDVPSSTGLGTSSSFTVGLIKLLSVKLGLDMSPIKIAETAIDIERNIVGHHGGIQDQWWAANGGVGCYNFGVAKVKFMSAPEVLQESLQKYSFLCYLGGQRSSSDTLKVDLAKEQSGSPVTDVRVFHRRNILGKQARDFETRIWSIESSEVNGFFSNSLLEAWVEKKRQISIDSGIVGLINELESEGIPFKLCGAGGTGFLYFYLYEEEAMTRIKSILYKHKLILIKIMPENKGVEVVYHDR